MWELREIYRYTSAVGDFQSLGFRVCVGFRCKAVGIEGLGIRVFCLGFNVQDLRFRL